MRGPLTFQQLFLWDYFHLENGERPRDASVFRIVGSLDSGLLAGSLNEVIRRHDCLRTRIVMTDGILEQHVDEPGELELEMLDLARLAQSDRESQAGRFIHEFVRRKCDLAVGPLAGAALIKLSPDSHLFAWAVHHVMADGISGSILLSEIWSVYSELLQRRRPHLSHTPVRYLEYARWQHATHNDWLEKHARHWQDRLAGAARAQWPSDAHVASGERVNAWFEMDFRAIPLADLRRLARSARTTPAMVMLAVYAAIVARWCGQGAFTIPVNLAGRHHPEHEHAAGYFAQFIYVGVEIAASDTFLELLARVSGEFRGALLHQDFGKVAIQAPDVLVGSMFSWLPWGRDTHGLPAACVSSTLGFSVQQFPFTPPSTLLAFHGIGTFFFEADGEFSAALWYRTDVFAASTVERFAADLCSTCERVVANPQCLLIEKGRS
jgi:hypothetical protein